MSQAIKGRPENAELCRGSLFQASVGKKALEGWPAASVIIHLGGRDDLLNAPILAPKT